MVPRPRPLIALTLIALPLALAGCGRGDKAPDPLADRDPAVTNALGDPIMADPDLAGQNQGGAALTGGGPASGEIPRYRTGPDEAAAARDAAITLTGSPPPPAPAASASEAASPRASAVTAMALAEALFALPHACAAQGHYSAVWATRLPPPFPVYPRGHVGEAAGADAPGCSWRVVGFVSAVSATDLVDFYHSRARAAGFAPAHTRAGEDEVISGAKGAARLKVLIRPRADGLSEAVLATAGG